jgi:RNA polymerase sigma-70 factor (ECF subfamily)
MFHGENAQHDSVESNDEEIILSYKNGNEEAFRELINRYSAPLYNFVARLSGKNEAPDIIQETFIKVWKNIERFSASKASFKTWIFTIAKNTTTDFLRKSGSASGGKKSLLFSDINNDDEEDMDSFAENIPDESLLPDEALQELQEKTRDENFLNGLLEKIRPDQREILILHYQEEMTFEEIGKVLDKPLNTVKSSHHRALIKLRKMLG